nr:MAG TPA: hypothetical protein [Caudoviricetes sp.]
MIRKILHLLCTSFPHNLPIRNSGRAAPATKAARPV